MKIAVITGASSGMGREFAIQLSQEVNLDEMWVIAAGKRRWRRCGIRSIVRFAPLRWIC